MTRDLTAGPLSSKTNIASGCFSIPTSNPNFSGLNFKLFVQYELGTIWDTEPHHPQQKGQVSPTVLTTCRLKENYWVLQHPKSDLETSEIWDSITAYTEWISSVMSQCIWFLGISLTSQEDARKSMQTGDLLFSKDIMTFVIAFQPISWELSQTLYPLHLQLLTLLKQS